MKKDFIEKVKRGIIVDTRKYRYYCNYTGHGCIIRRCPIEYLGRTAALGPWEVITDETEARYDEATPE